jgi:MarR family transcriptional regulator for hemolysin
MDSVARRIVLTAKTMRAHFEAHLAAAGASLPYWLVLEQLVVDDGLSQRELARRLSLEAPTLTRHVDHMAAEGLLTRTPDTRDRRVTRISITPEGRALHQRLMAVAQGREQDLRSIITDREAAVLERVLSRISHHLEDADAAAG